MTRKLILFVVLFTFSLNSYSQTRLNSAKSDLKNSSSSSSSESSSSNDDDNDFLELLLIEAIAEPLLTVGGLITYGILIETEWEKNSNMHYARFTPYPYAYGAYGDYMYEPVGSIDSLTPARVDLNNSLVRSDSRLFGNHLNAKVRFEKRFSIDGGYLQLFENGPLGNESFSFFNTSINYYRIRTNRFSLWYGPGVGYIGNEVKRFGFTLNTGAEWFVARPVSLFASYKHTFLGSDTVSLFESRLKYHIKNYNLSGGFERYKLGSVNLSNVAVGVGVSF